MLWITCGGVEIVGRSAMCNEGVAHVCVTGTGRGTGSYNGEGAEGGGRGEQWNRRKCLRNVALRGCDSWRIYDLK